MIGANDLFALDPSERNGRASVDAEVVECLDLSTQAADRNPVVQ
jgi:hypothetical protein